MDGGTGNSAAGVVCVCNGRASGSGAGVGDGECVVNRWNAGAAGGFVERLGNGGDCDFGLESGAIIRWRICVVVCGGDRVGDADGQIGVVEIIFESRSDRGGTGVVWLVAAGSADTSGVGAEMEDGGDASGDATGGVG